MALKKAIAAAVIVLGAGTVWAAKDRSLEYGDFARSVSHIPLAECPALVTARNADCHAATIDGALHVLAFEKGGERKLLAVHSEAGPRDADSFRVSANN